MVNALKIDATNLRVLTELGALQSQHLQDYEGYCDTRRRIAVGKPTTQDWIQYCFAAYGCQNYKLAMEVMVSIHEIIEGATAEKPILKPNDLNELLLFNSLLIEKAESVKKAIKFLTNSKNRKRIIDDIRYNERLAALYCQNNQKPKAIECLNEVIAINSSNEATYKAVLSAQDLDVNNKEHHTKITEVLDAYTAKTPKINTPLLFLLKILEAGDVFKARLTRYVRPLVIKGVVSLVNGMKWIYKDAAKSKVFGDVLTFMCQTMESEMALSPEDEEEQDPTV